MASVLWSALVAVVFALTALVLGMHAWQALGPTTTRTRSALATRHLPADPLATLLDVPSGPPLPLDPEPHALACDAESDGLNPASDDIDGEWAYPAAGQSARAPTDPGDTPHHAPLRKYPGKSITLLTDAKPEFAAELLVKLDSFMVQANSALTDILGGKVPAKPTQLILFESQERYQEYAHDNAPGLVNNGGYYDGATRTAVTYRYNNSMQLYFHELVHVLMGEQFGDHSFSRYTRKNWPIWFDEGLCELIGSFQVVGTGLKVPGVNKSKLAYLYNAMAHNTLVDLPSLVRAPAERFSGSSMNIYYAEAWGLLDFLVNAPEHKGRVAAFFARIHSGEDGIEALKAVFGHDLVALDRSWRRWLLDRAKQTEDDVQLFNGQSIDDWAVHEGGQWQVVGGEIQAIGNSNHNYLIKSELPVGDFSYELDMNLSRGTAGLILGNNYHAEYPYYFLVDVSRDAVLLRRATSASLLEPLMQAWADIPPGKWRHLRVSVIDHVLRIDVAGREALTMRVDRERFSLFGIHVSQARARFRNLVVHQERTALTQPPARPMTPVGGPSQGL